TPPASAPATANRRAAPPAGRTTSDGDVRLERIELLLADAGDLHQILDAPERPVLRAVVDDLLGEHGTDTRQILEVRLRRAVDVDLSPRLLRRGPAPGGKRRLALLRNDHLLAVDQRPREVDGLRFGAG